jgi:predicted TIM-barrel fold metal-dependent hydrolase
VIVDFHCHVWPDAVAPRALGASIPEMSLRGDGTVAGLEAAQDEAGVDVSVCLSIATRANLVERTNTFAGSLDTSRFVGFGTVHLDLTPEENLTILRASGVKGVKLHPTFQRFALDDPAVLGVLEALAGEFPVITHVGAGGGGDGSGATPRMVRDIARALPGLTLIACHFGGYRMLDESVELIGENVLMDTSWPPSLATLDPDRVRGIVQRHGVRRVLFASDWPTASPRDEIAAIRALGLPEEDETLVLGGNAQRVLGL